MSCGTTRRLTSALSCHAHIAAPQLYRVGRPSAQTERGAAQQANIFYCARAARTQSSAHDACVRGNCKWRPRPPNRIQPTSSRRSLTYKGIQLIESDAVLWIHYTPASQRSRPTLGGEEEAEAEEFKTKPARSRSFSSRRRSFSGKRCPICMMYSANFRTDGFVR